MRYHLTPVRMGIIKKSRNNKCWTTRKRLLGKWDGEMMVMVTTLLPLLAPIVIILTLGGRY